MEPRDGALPSPVLREGVLAMLTQLPIDAADERRRNQLKASGVGRVVLFYSRLPEETPGNRRAARSLVERWSRPVFEAHREDLVDVIGGGPEAKRERELGALQARAAAQAAADARAAPIGGAAGAAAAAAAAAARRRAAPPRAPRLDYVVKPRSDATEGMGGSGSGSGTGKKGETSKVEGRLKAMQRRAKAGAPRAARISVEGRGL